jgi:hypothetical protein
LETSWTKLIVKLWVIAIPLSNITSYTLSGDIIVLWKSSRKLGVLKSYYVFFLGSNSKSCYCFSNKFDKNLSAVLNGTNELVVKFDLYSST